MMTETETLLEVIKSLPTDEPFIPHGDRTDLEVPFRSIRCARLATGRFLLKSFQPCFPVARSLSEDKGRGKTLSGLREDLLVSIRVRPGEHLTEFSGDDAFFARIQHEGVEDYCPLIVIRASHFNMRLAFA